MSVRSISRPQTAAPVKPPATKVFRGNLEIWSEQDLKQLEGVTHVTGNLTVQTQGKKLSLPHLVQVDGELNLGNDAAIELKALKRVGGGLSFAGSPKLARISLPQLEVAKGGVNVSSASYPLPKLKVLELPRLREAGIFMTQSSGLAKLSLPNLRKIESMQVSDHPSLSAIDLPLLKSVEQRFSLNGNPKLPEAARRQLSADLAARGVDASRLFISR